MLIVLSSSDLFPHRGSYTPRYRVLSVNVIDKVFSEYSLYGRIQCKKCGELNYLTPHAFWIITDFGAKYENAIRKLVRGVRGVPNTGKKRFAKDFSYCEMP